MSKFNLSERGETKVTVDFGGMFIGLLTILFIGLKLTGYIEWSWVWVLSPLWVPLAIVIAVLVVALVIIAVVALASAIVDRYWK